MQTHISRANRARAKLTVLSPTADTALSTTFTHGGHPISIGTTLNQHRPDLLGCSADYQEARREIEK